jgi:hypothetical protein
LLYATTGGHALGATSESTPAQAVKKIVTAARAACGRVQHVAVDFMSSLQLIEPLNGTTGALGSAAQVENEEGDREHDEADPRQLPCP